MLLAADALAPADCTADALCMQHTRQVLKSAVSALLSIEYVICERTAAYEADINHERGANAAAPAVPRPVDSGSARRSSVQGSADARGVSSSRNKRS